MNRKIMIDNIIRTYGHEHPYTIWFCKFAENLNNTNTTVEGAYIVLSEIIKFNIL